MQVFGLDIMVLSELNLRPVHCALLTPGLELDALTQSGLFKASRVGFDPQHTIS